MPESELTATKHLWSPCFCFDVMREAVHATPNKLQRANALMRCSAMYNAAAAWRVRSAIITVVCSEQNEISPSLSGLRNWSSADREYWMCLCVEQNRMEGDGMEGKKVQWCRLLFGELVKRKSKKPDNSDNGNGNGND